MSNPGQGMADEIVIVYDPDFNPHQDLQVSWRYSDLKRNSADMQAIARSHRYGQNKKVLVFKLMTKDSIEGELVHADG